MKRRVVAVFLSLAMVAALATGCGNSGKEASGTSSDTKTESTNDKESVFIQPITSMPASLQPSTKSVIRLLKQDLYQTDYWLKQPMVLNIIWQTVWKFQMMEKNIHFI